MVVVTNCHIGDKQRSLAVLGGFCGGLCIRIGLILLLINLISKTSVASPTK